MASYTKPADKKRIIRVRDQLLLLWSGGRIRGLSLCDNSGCRSTPCGCVVAATEDPCTLVCVAAARVGIVVIAMIAVHGSDHDSSLPTTAIVDSGADAGFVSRALCEAADIP